MDPVVGLSSCGSEHRRGGHQEVERIAEVLILLQVSPERASRGLRQLFTIPLGEAMGIVRGAVARQLDPARHPKS